MHRLFQVALILLICGLSACAALHGGGSATGASKSAPDQRALSLALHRGTFVAADATCADPPLAALLFYNGRGFDGAHSHACRARIVDRDGTHVTLINSCIDAGVGEAPRTSLPLTLTLIDADHFAVHSDTGDQAYRRCTTDQLPASLRRRPVSED